MAAAPIGTGPASIASAGLRVGVRAAAGGGGGALGGNGTGSGRVVGSLRARLSASSLTSRSSCLGRRWRGRPRPAAERRRRAGAAAASRSWIAQPSRRPSRRSAWPEPERAAINGHWPPCARQQRAPSDSTSTARATTSAARPRPDPSANADVVDHEEVGRGLERVDERRECRRNRRTGVI